MSETSYWQKASNLVFSLTIFALAVGLLVITIVALFTSLLWVIGIALPFTIVGAHLCYSRARGKFLGRTLCCVFFPLLVIAMTVMTFYGPLVTPAPLLFLAGIEFFVALTLILTITGLLCERYFSPKLGELKTDI